MFLVFPIVSFLFVYVFLAALPALILLHRIYKQDTIEHEPKDLLFRLILMGFLAGLLSMVLELVLSKVLNMLGLDPASLIYVLLEAFIMVAMVEEGTKYFLTIKTTWNHPAFNYQFDGIVYCVFTSLGFAIMENVGYTISYGTSVLLSRALLSIPGHMSFAVIMGACYGRAKVAESYGKDEEASSLKRKGYLLAVLLHGTYDACLIYGSTVSLIIFAVIVVCVYLIILRLTTIEASQDRPVAGETVETTFNPFEDVKDAEAVEVETEKYDPLKDLKDKYDNM